MSGFVRRRQLVLRNQSGFGLIDAVATLLIFGVLVVAFLNYSDRGKGMMNGFLMKMDVSAMTAAVNDWAQGRTSLAGLNIAAVQSRLPASIGNGVGTNPWGGNYTIAPGVGPFQWVLTATGVPAAQGPYASSGYTTAAFNSATGVVTVTLGQ